jgi:peptidoglycan/xylan/chitin deacetylase (PgdA/CDA1 family)
MPLPQLAMAAREGWLPERAVAVTFDDGYLDNLRVASPILLEYAVPATFFITDAVLEGRVAYWWDALAAMFFGTAPLPPRLALRAARDTIDLPTASAQEREHAHWILYHRLREADAPERDALLAQVKAWAGVTTADDGRPMNRFELEDLARRPGHSIGGHGSDHLSYSAHPPAVVRRDVRENRMKLEVAVGRIVTSFAYPYGDHDDQSVEIVDELGYRAAVTCVEGLVRPRTDPLRLPRVAIGPADAARFADRLQALFAAPMSPT